MPSEANAWVAAADMYDASQLDEDGLTATRVEAWEFHDSVRNSLSSAEVSSLRAVMYRLWPSASADDWYNSAWHFLQFCREAGLHDDQWWPLLKEHFSQLLEDGR